MRLTKNQIASVLIHNSLRLRAKALAELKELDYQARRKKYSDVPNYAIVKNKFSDQTANGLTVCILTWLSHKEHMAWRQGSEGRYRPGKTFTDVLGHKRQLKGTWLPGQTVGAADVCGIIGGVFFAFEVKLKDRQSAEQKKYQTEVMASGGKYFIVRSFEEFRRIYDENTTQKQREI